MGNASGSGGGASRDSSSEYSDHQMNKLRASLKSLSLRGRQLFQQEMAGGRNKQALRTRGEKRHRDEIPTGSMHKEPKEHGPEDDDLSSDVDSTGGDADLDVEDTELGMMPGAAKKKNRGAWTPDQDAALKIAVEKYEGKNWKAIAREVPGNRTHIQCLQRWGKVLKPGLIKGPWTEEEDELLRTYVPLESKGNWVAVAEHVPGRTAKQCRERWSLCLDPAIRKDPWSPEEDELLLQLHDTHGNAWATIAKYLPGRTENATKSRFKSIERKKDRAWTPLEDAAIIRGKAEEKKWGAITSMLPKSNRTKHAVKTRWKELMEINPALKRFDSLNRKTSSDVSMAGTSLPSFTDMAAKAAASTPPEMHPTYYVTPQMPPAISDESSPPNTYITHMSEAIDESASFPRILNNSLSSDKLMNMRIQRNESFEDWLAKEAGGITALPIMSGGFSGARAFDDQFGGPFNLSMDDLADLELV